MSQNIKITLPNGDVKEFLTSINGFDIASEIGPGLAKAAIALKVDGVQRDLSHIIDHDASVSILTVKDPEGLEIMRHSTTAQVLAKAIKQLWPQAKLAVGPTIENGFYYDVDLGDAKLTDDDLPKIDQEMRDIIASNKDTKIIREMWNHDDATRMFETRGESYKAEIIRDADKDDTTEKGKISLYRQGEGEDGFIDLCRGPHVPNLKHISEHFKLTHVSGSYWRGDANGQKLQRVYGISFADKKALKQHIQMLEEAEKRDHRKLGREMGLFHFEQSAAAQVFWHHDGWHIYNQLIEYMRKKLQQRNYIEVNTPQMLDVSFWKYSGHWDKYRENMFVVNEDKSDTQALKPMSCPGNVQIYKSDIRSYRDLPIRMAEFGKVFRQEPAGARHGLMRVQAFTQDDAHIFCTPEQLEAEIIDMCELINEVYTELGFDDVHVKLATRPEMRIGSDEDWDKAERILQNVCERINLNWELNPGDGAFYAPKLDFKVRDAIGREWQLGTIQVDLNLPERLDISYIGEDGNKHRPYMVHRAIMGSLERFIGIMIEHYGGKFPLWLAPKQVAIATVITDANDYAQEIADKLKGHNIRVITDLRNEKISYKIREHSYKKVPIIMAVGAREVENHTVTIRRIGSKDQQSMNLDDAIKIIIDEVSEIEI